RLGLAAIFSWLEVKQRRDGIFVCQKKYACDILERFHVDKESQVAITPIKPNEKLQRKDGTGRGDERMFRGLVGGLNYLTHTRPDIAHCDKEEEASEIWCDNKSAIVMTNNPAFHVRTKQIEV
ncbi:hypothetical protein V2J09_000499, partial [Rumex salicifolius]